MMIKRPRQSFDDDMPVVLPITVYPQEEPEKTGILDADGRPLVRLREPIGYIRNALR